MCDPPLSLCLVFYGLVLADGFTVFHGHLGLVGTHLFALPKSVEQEATCTVRKLNYNRHVQAASDSIVIHRVAAPSGLVTYSKSLYACMWCEPLTVRG